MLDTLTRPGIHADGTSQRIMTRIYWASVAVAAGSGAAIVWGAADMRAIAGLTLAASLGAMVISFIGETFAACGMTRSRR